MAATSRSAPAACCPVRSATARAEPAEPRSPRPARRWRRRRSGTGRGEGGAGRALLGGQGASPACFCISPRMARPAPPPGGLSARLRILHGDGGEAAAVLAPWPPRWSVEREQVGLLARSFTEATPRPPGGSARQVAHGGGDAPDCSPRPRRSGRPARRRPAHRPRAPRALGQVDDRGGLPGRLARQLGDGGGGGGGPPERLGPGGGAAALAGGVGQQPVRHLGEPGGRGAVVPVGAAEGGAEEITSRARAVTSPSVSVRSIGGGRTPAASETTACCIPPADAAARPSARRPGRRRARRRPPPARPAPAAASW